jgi:hypothetical protein
MAKCQLDKKKIRKRYPQLEFDFTDTIDVASNDAYEDRSLYMLFRNYDENEAWTFVRVKGARGAVDLP